MSGRVAVVTGAAGGLGSAFVRVLLDQRETVIGVDLSRDGLDRLAGELAPTGGDRFHAEDADLTAPNEVAALFDRIAGRFGGIDILVNNAGTCFMTDFVDIPADELRRQMAVNFDSAFYCCQRALPLMLDRPGIKKIVNISSNGAYNFDVFDPAHYRASKAALDNLTKHLARRYAREAIAVNSLAPAMTRTPLFGIVSADVLEKALAGMPRGAMEASEIAAWVGFLASAAGDCCSGNVIILNQGRDVR
jgi:NAD(P)-dependent dehydrogenase (short-subunit alcohol dehydrogenase family)